MALEAYYYNPYAVRDERPVSPLSSTAAASSHQGHRNGAIPEALGLQSLRPSNRDSLQQDAYDVAAQPVSPMMSRSPSIASDRRSTVSQLTATYFAPNPQSVNPPPLYVAHDGARQVVSEHRAGNLRQSSDDEDLAPNKDDCQFSEAALALINTFLDQLLFSFLATARSTNLAVLRPAVTEVLKARLARDAIASADGELKELLAGGEEEEMNTQQNNTENRRKWDLELVWKRTRLRVMVYMRLGEMEDEDEERYIQEEDLFHATETRRFSQTSGLVSWAAAIFLTGILEFIAEQTLQVAGQAACTRARRQSRTTRATTSETAHKPVIVEEYDVEKVALNSLLGRLWRTWRKNLRSSTPAPGTSTPTHRQSLSRGSNDVFYTAMSNRRGSTGGAGGDGSVNGDVPRSLRLDDVPEMDYPEHVLASNIPLPIGDIKRDIDEIEVPGLAIDPDAADEENNGCAMPIARRNSFTGLAEYAAPAGLLQSDSGSSVKADDPPTRPVLVRQRSMSVPIPARMRMLTEEMRRPPGAFPEDEDPSGQVLENPAAKQKEEAEEEQTVSDEDEQGEAEEQNPNQISREQKANANEMAPHKHSSQDIKRVLAQDVDVTQPEEQCEQSDKGEGRGILGGVIAGATAAAAATAAALYGSMQRNDQKVESEQRVENDYPAEDVDKRKSLIDLKDIIAAAQRPKNHSHEGAQILQSRHVSMSRASPTLVRTPSDESRNSGESRTSYTLGQKDGQVVVQQSPGKRLHTQGKVEKSDDLKEDIIGVARTSDAYVPSSRSLTPSDGVDGQQAGNSTKRPSRLVLGATPPRNNHPGESMTYRQSPKGSPRDFLESRSLVPKPSDAGAGLPDDQSCTIKAPQKRMSISGAAFTSVIASPVAERNSPGQTVPTAPQQRGQLNSEEPPVSNHVIPSKPESDKTNVSDKDIAETSQVQEHPVLQRMASLKHRERKKSEASSNGDAGLTSASIRGPEDFDSFVQGAETVKYTLTPESVRENTTRSQPAELSSGPSVSKHKVPPIDTSDARTGRSPVPKQATSAGIEKGDDEERQRKRANRRSISRPEQRNVNEHQRSGFMAREPRVQTESTRDFADFIRSTGPSKDPIITPLVSNANRSTTSLNSMRSARVNGPSRSSSIASQDRSKSLPRLGVELEDVPPVPTLPNKSKINMQPRGAKGTGGNNSELIDFIRSGPEQIGQHRIPRAVAPFRSTMDSDQLKEISDSITGDGTPDMGLSGGISTTGSQSSMKASTARTSVNSRSQLLNNGVDSTVHPAHSGMPQRLGSAMAESEDGIPGRKRYRNKDPYAIDLSDDEDDLLTALPKTKRQEESLIDFLNSMEPPKENAPCPLIDPNSAQARNLMARARASSTNTKYTGAGPSSDSIGPRTRSMQSSGGPRPGTTYASSTRSTQSNNGGARPRLEARAPGDSNRDFARSGGYKSATSDLADFLRNSAPPDDDKSAPSPIVGRHSKLAPKEAEKLRKKSDRNVSKTDLETKKRGFFGSIKTKQKRWLDMS
ncbi:hypothetical protein M433DRAFT_536 [Acidomyces richmondensis BFW]|nr:MAG: hypothetical protein FE78DRAFT_69245 [Acidomyces sp. 'richmondensis']KYG50108.1 hypothetical protein M433DRAFT_536 [Acidomyces richmondensis BFW]